MTQRQVFPPISLTTQGLACGRGETALVRDLTIDLTPGRGLVLRGANGAGKSTLLLTLAGLLPPLAGTVAFAGHDPETGPVLHHCGHRNAVRARLGVAETLDFWGAINGGDGLSVEAALERVGLAKVAKLDAGYLSAGQGRRLALARLLVSPRPIWLLDEPTASLDAGGQDLLIELLHAHLADGGIAVIASHDAITLDQVDVLTLGEAR